MRSLLLLGGFDLPGGHVLIGEPFLVVSCAEDEVPEPPVQSEVAVSVVVVVGVVVEIQRASIVGQQCVDAGEEADGRDEEGIHGVNQGAHEMPHGSLEDGFEGMDCVLREGSGLHELLSRCGGTWWKRWTCFMTQSMCRKWCVR
jgi:hypothetical protein